MYTYGLALQHSTARIRWRIRGQGIFPTVLWTAPLISWWKISPTMKVGHIKLSLGHLTFASWRAPGFPCSELIPSPGYSKEWRRWCSSFVQAVNLLDLLLFTVKYRWIASRHIHRHWWIKQFPSALLQLKIHYWSFILSFWLKATWMLKFYIDPGSRAVCLPTITKAAGRPGAPVLIPYVFFFKCTSRS